MWAADDAVGVGSAKKGGEVAKELPTTAGKLIKTTDDWLKNGIPMSEVEKHNNEESAWIVVNNRVYDCTPYLKDHPGGASSIVMNAGMEA